MWQRCAGDLFRIETALKTIPEEVRRLRSVAARGRRKLPHCLMWPQSVAFRFTWPRAAILPQTPTRPRGASQKAWAACHCARLFARPEVVAHCAGPPVRRTVRSRALEEDLAMGPGLRRGSFGSCLGSHRVGKEPRGAHVVHAQRPMLCFVARAHGVGLAAATFS